MPSAAGFVSASLPPSALLDAEDRLSFPVDLAVEIRGVDTLVDTGLLETSTAYRQFAAEVSGRGASS